MKTEYLLGGMLQNSDNQLLYVFARNGNFVTLNGSDSYKLARRWKTFEGVNRFIEKERAAGSNWIYCVLAAPEFPSAGSALGRMGAGVPRVLSEEERQVRRERLAKLRVKRWKGQ